jgi:hypothetical protein
VKPTKCKCTVPLSKFSKTWRRLRQEDWRSRPIMATVARTYFKKKNPQRQKYFIIQNILDFSIHDTVPDRSDIDTQPYLLSSSVISIMKHMNVYTKIDLQMKKRL